MHTQTLEIRRLSTVSSRPFAEVLKELTANISQPDMNALHGALARTKTLADLEELVRGALGSSQLMEFVRFDLGRILAAERGGSGPKLLRLILGNPLIMKEMVKATPDAASYAPVTILVDERPDGVHLSYDSMASLLAPYGSEAALAVARALDATVEGPAGDRGALTSVPFELLDVLAPLTEPSAHCGKAQDCLRRRGPEPRE